jgi:ornithine--oxo-acid transaminase
MSKACIPRCSTARALIRARLDIRAERARDGRRPRNAAELDEQNLVAHTARLGERLLELTLPLVERYDVVHDVRGLGLLWAIEFAEPESGKRSYRLLDRVQPGLFAQVVVVPLFKEHRILSQVAGHRIPVVKGIPPLTVSESDLDWFAEALDETIRKAQRLPRALARLALTAAGVR